MSELGQDTVHLRRLGLSCNPFATYYGETDPNVAKYLVHNEAFELTKEHCMTFTYAPLGGGKSTFVTRLARACRAREDGEHIFPVILRNPLPGPAYLHNGGRQLLRELAQAAAKEIWLTMLTRPGEFVILENHDLEALANLIEAALPGMFYRKYLPDARRRSPQDLVADLDKTAVPLPIPPDPQADLAPLLDRLESIPSKQHHQTAAEQLFLQAVDLSQNLLHYDAVFVLVDGIDSWGSSENNPKEVLELLDFFFKQVPQWEQRHIYLKFFLPDHLISPVRNLFAGKSLTSYANEAIITWSDSSIQRLLEYRLAYASGGQFDSFARFSPPHLRDIEAQLAKNAHGNPRRAVILAYWVLNGLLAAVPGSNADLPLLTTEILQAAEANAR